MKGQGPSISDGGSSVLALRDLSSLPGSTTGSFDKWLNLILVYDNMLHSFAKCKQAAAPVLLL